MTWDLIDHDTLGDERTELEGESPSPSVAPGRRTLTMRLKARSAIRRGARGTDRPRDADSGTAADAIFDRATASGAREVPHRAAMEHFFGVDLGGVRAFVDRPGEMAAIDAHAAARGEDVVFADRDPAPSLVAHELAHVVQHRLGTDAGAIDGAGGLSDPSSQAEREADAAAALFASGGSRPSLSATPVGVGRAAIYRFNGGGQTGIDFVATNAPALATALATYFPALAPAQLTEMATGLLEKLATQLPEALQLSPAAIGAIAGGLGKLYAAYQKGDPVETPTERLKEAVHDTVPASLSSLASTLLPASAFAAVLPASAAAVVSGAIAWGVYLGARKLLPERGTLPQPGDKLALGGGLLELEVTSAARPWFGYYAVTATVTGNPADAAWLEAGGEVTLSMADRTQVVGVSDASKLTLTIGGFEISKLVLADEVAYGLTATGGEVKAPWGGTGTLTELTVSSGGWLAGAARVMGGQRQANGLSVANASVRFAPTFRDGVQLDDALLDLDVNGEDMWPTVTGLVPVAHQPLQFGPHPIELCIRSFFNESLDVTSCLLSATSTTLTMSGAGVRYKAEDGDDGKRVQWKATRTGINGPWAFRYQDADAATPGARADDAPPGQPEEEAPGLGAQPGAPSEPATEPEPPKPASRGGKDLVSTLHDKFTAAAFENRSPVVKYAVTPLLTAAHWGAWAWKKVKPVTPAKVDATQTKPELATASPQASSAPAQDAQPSKWAWLNPMEYSGIKSALDAMPTFEFGAGVPELPKLAFDKLRFSVDDVGGKLMVRGGGALTVTMPGESGVAGPSGTGDVELRWFPFDEPFLSLQAAVKGTDVALTGIEADLSDGIRVAHGVAKLPLPADLSPGGYLQAAMDYLQLGHGFRFRSIKGSLNNIKIPADAAPEDIHAILTKAEVGGAAGAKGTRFHADAAVTLHNLTQGTIETSLDVAWGGGEPVSVGGKVTKAPFQPADWLKADSALVGVSYRARKLGAEVSATGLIATPIDGLEIKLASGKLQLGPKGLAGSQLVGGEVTYRGLGARVDRLEVLDGGGLEIKGLSLVAAPAKLVDLPFFQDLGFTAPDWLDDIKLRVGVDITRKDGKTTFSAPRFGVVAAGVRLFGVGGGFDLEQGKAFVRLYKSGTFRPTAQFPVYPGVGVEVGGLLRYRVGLEGDAKISGATEQNPDAPTRIEGGLNLKGNLEGSVVAGVFGGIPGVFTVGGGVHAGLTLAVEALARIDGALHMPSKSHPRGAGSFGFDFKIAGPGDQPAIASVVAGPYIFVDFAGISKTMKLDLLQVPLLQLEAYGGMRLDAPPKQGVDEDGKHIHTIPDPFPAYRVQVAPELTKAFDSGKNALLKHRIRQAEQNLGKELAKVGGAERRIRDEHALNQLDPSERDGARSDLEATDRKARETAQSRASETTQSNQDIETKRARLEKEIEEVQLAEIYYGAKKRHYEWQLRANDPDSDPSLVAKAKHHLLDVPRDTLGHLRQGRLGAAIATTRSTAKGRAPSNLSVEERLAQQKQHSGTGPKRELTREELALKVQHKDEELARLAEHLSTLQQQLASLEDGWQGRADAHASAQQDLLEQQTVVELHGLRLEKDYQAERQSSHDQRVEKKEQLKESRSDAVQSIKGGNLLGAFRWVRAALQTVGTEIEGGVDSAQHTLTSDKDKSLERYLDHHQHKLLDAWDEANHVYRITERRRIYDKAHLEKRKAERETIAHRIAELTELQRQGVTSRGAVPDRAVTDGRTPPKVPPKPAHLRARVIAPPPDPMPSSTPDLASPNEPTSSPMTMPDPITNGPAFEIAFELKFWQRRLEDVQRDIERLEQRHEDAVLMTAPGRKLTEGQRALLDHAAEAQGNTHTAKRAAEVDRKTKDLEGAVEELMNRRQAEAELVNQLEELEARKQAAPAQAPALDKKLAELRSKLKTAAVKVKQQQFLVDAAQSALDLTVRNIDESKLLKGED